MAETMHVLHCCCERDCKAPAKFFVDYNGALEGHPQLSIRKGFCEQHASDWMMTRATTPMVGEEFESNLALAINDAMCAATDEGKKTTTEVTARILADPNVRAILSRLPAAGGQSNNRKEGEANTGLQPAQHNDRPRSDTVSGAASGGASQSTERDRVLEEAAQVAENLLLAVIPDQCSTRDSLKFQREKIAERIRAMQTSAAAHTRSNAADMEGALEAGCICHRCIRELDLRDTSGHFPLSSVRMIVCRECGNKRCPKASDHRLTCTGSNESGQVGSVYSTPDIQQTGEDDGTARDNPTPAL